MEPSPESNAVPAESVDVICMLDDVEHLPDPMAYLSQAFKLLRAGGLLVLTTPDDLSILDRLLGGRWAVFDGQEHIHIFSCQGLVRLLEQIEFHVIRSGRLWKRTTLHYLLSIIGAWVSRDSSHYRSTIRLGRLSITFYAGEWYLILMKP